MRSFRALLPAFALATLLAGLAGCGPVDGGGYPPDTTPMSQSTGSVAGTGGKLFIQWTLDGAAPSAAACARIDHLTLSLFYPEGRVSIAPIPCTLTRFRYDGLPPGSATLKLDGVDRRGCQLTHGEVRTTLAATVPDMPSPTVALTATGATCP